MYNVHCTYYGVVAAKNIDGNNFLNTKYCANMGTTDNHIY